MRKRSMMCVALAAAWLFALKPAGAIDTANPDASPDAKKILNYLPALPGHYDRRVISGQQFGPGENAGRLFEEQVKTLHNAAGKWVAMVGADYGSPKSNAESGADLSALNQVLVDYWKAGGLVTISFHARNPWTGGSAWDTSTADLKDLVSPGTEANLAWMQELNRVAAGLAQKNTEGAREITDDIVRDALQKRILLYDKSGEEHYNLISALHKSVRNSDPDAALYWLGRMLEAGEDPLYVARRVVRMAVEDIGLADPNALSLCMAARDAVDFIGMPEGNLALAEAVVYLSVAPKSNALYTAYGNVQQDVEQTAADSVPLHLRNAPTSLMKGLGYGQGYQYAHDLEGKVADMQCLPDNLRDRVYYHPTNEGIEKRIRERMEEIKRQRSRAMEGGSPPAKKES